MKVLIVEDEYYARKRLVKMILEWDSSVIITEDVETGREAVASIISDEPDIVLTDIRMPEMDGLELSHYIMEHHPTISVAILTGYADFEYARQALRNNVKAYLLKPLKKEELYELMDDLKGNWKKRMLEREQYDMAIRSVSSFQLIWKLTSAIYDHNPLDESFSDIFHLSQEPRAFRIIVCKCFGYITDQDEEVYNRLLHMKECSRGFGFVNPIMKNEWIGIGFSAEGARSFTERPLGEEIHFLNNNDRQFSAGISQLHATMELLGQAYREAKYAAAQHLLSRPCRLFEYRNIKDINGTERVEQLISKLLQELKAGRPASVKRIIRSIFTGFQEDGQGTLRQLQQLYSKIDSTIRNEMSEPVLHEIPKKEIDDFASFEQLIDVLNRQVDLVCDTLSDGELKEGQSQELIDDIMSYVAKNYACDISLEFLAKHKYYMNSSYLSRLFKTKTGQGFSDFLTACRMKKAKELIETNWFTISEVAGLVGYTKPSHFIQMFKKHYGETPGSYKSTLRPDLLT